MSAIAQQTRRPERVRAHYEVERQLADRLRESTRGERLRLYAQVYDELYRSVPDHPQLARRDAEADTSARASSQLRLVRRFLSPGGTLLEVGAGDCRLSVAASRHAGRVYAIDVSREIAGATVLPPNVSLVLSDGVSIDVPKQSVDLAYSNREYALRELVPLMQSAGFMRTRAALAPAPWAPTLTIPAAVLIALERGLDLLRPVTRRRVAHSLPVRKLIAGALVATKG